VDTDLIQLAGDADLVLEGEADPLPLRAIPERAIVDRDHWFVHRLAHLLILLQAQFALDLLKRDRGWFPTTLIEERHELLVLAGALNLFFEVVLGQQKLSSISSS